MFSQNNSNNTLDLQDTFENLIRKGLNQDKREQVQGNQGQEKHLNQTQVLDHLDESQLNQTAPAVMGQFAPNLSLDSEIQRIWKLGKQSLVNGITHKWVLLHIYSM